MSFSLMRHHFVCLGLLGKDWSKGKKVNVFLRLVSPQRLNIQPLFMYGVVFLLIVLGTFLPKNTSMNMAWYQKHLMIIFFSLLMNSSGRTLVFFNMMEPLVTMPKELNSFLQKKYIEFFDPLARKFSRPKPN